MKIKVALFGLLSLLCVSVADAADWFENAGSHMGRIEPSSDGSIWLMVPWSSPNAVTVSGHTSSCSVSQIHLLPPTGQEKAWLAALLAAAAAGKGVAVYGECVETNYRIDATRLVVDY